MLYNEIFMEQNALQAKLIEQNKMRRRLDFFDKILMGSLSC